MGGIFGKQKTWDDFPVELDGWKVSHDSLRFFMTLMVNTMDKLIADAEADALSKENIGRFTTFVDIFCKQVHDHHDHEEKIFFPWMQTKIQLPPKMSADHKTLIANLEEVQKRATALEAADTSAEQLEALKSCRVAFVEMQEHMCAHLKEEEEEGIPMVRENFTFQEHEVPVNAIIKSMEWFELPQTIYQMNDADRMKFMQVAGIPSLIIALVMKGRIRRFEKEIMTPFLAIGQEVPARV